MYLNLDIKDLLRLGLHWNYNILAKALAGSFIIDNFENANDIINNLRYHDCQYFVLFMDENGIFNYENSTKLKVKIIDNNYEISFYE